MKSHDNNTISSNMYSAGAYSTVSSLFFISDRSHRGAHAPKNGKKDDIIHISNKCKMQITVSTSHFINKDDTVE